MFSPRDQERLATNLAAIRLRMARACQEASRDPAEVSLVAVTKYGGAALVRALLQLGQRDLGESRVDHLEQTLTALAAAPLSESPRWHLVGHLQRNKAKRVAETLHALHSLDSLLLAQRLNSLRQEASAGPLRVFVQVRLSPDLNRPGVEPEALEGFLAELTGLTSLRVVGLMGLPPRGTPAEARAHFRTLRQLMERTQTPRLKRLSIGMTADLEEAIHEGATEVRVGRALVEGLSSDALSA